MRVTIDGELVADSSDVVRLEETGYPARYYFPRADVEMSRLERSSATSQCPFKGTASYFHMKIGDKRLEDAVWSYEEPYDEHRGIKDRIVFDGDKFSQVRIEADS